MRKIATQVSGRYSPDNSGVFKLKRHLTSAGATVNFPAGDSIIEYSCGFAVTVPEEGTTPFSQTEIKFIRSIKSSDVQIAYTSHGPASGYVGESTGIETAYAVCLNKPVIMTHAPSIYSPTLPTSILEILNKYGHHFTVLRLDLVDSSKLLEVLVGISAQRTEYGVSDGDRVTTMREVALLCRRYRSAWRMYQGIHEGRA